MKLRTSNEDEITIFQNQYKATIQSLGLKKKMRAF
jgi:hypothetical protein